MSGISLVSDQHPIKRVRTMIADDHTAFRQMVTSLLQSAGAEVLECESGREAVTHFAQFQPELVFMDIAMKELDGLSATAQIKARFPAARIFMLTQYNDPDLREAARKAGAEGYLLKDDLSQLHLLLRSVPPTA
jgi:CheY-like chemotaxis protein